MLEDAAIALNSIEDVQDIAQVSTNVPISHKQTHGPALCQMFCSNA